MNFLANKHQHDPKKKKKEFELLDIKSVRNSF